MSQSIQFYVLYYQGAERRFSHKYSERWQRIGMYCPHCGKQEVWQEDSPGDYYVGERYLCLACEHNWTIQGPNPPHPSDEQYAQRIANIRPSHSASAPTE